MYEYVENGSKNRSDGLAQMRVENKIARIRAVPENEPRCLVFLLDCYLAKLLNMLLLLMSSTYVLK